MGNMAMISEDQDGKTEPAFQTTVGDFILGKHSLGAALRSNL